MSSGAPRYAVSDQAVLLEGINRYLGLMIQDLDIQILRLNRLIDVEPANAYFPTAKQQIQDLRNRLQTEKYTIEQRIAGTTARD